MPLVASAFIEWPNQASHSRTFDRVIAAPEDIGLVFTGAANLFGSNQNLGFRSDLGATISIAQFGTTAMPSAVPEPGTLVLLALGGFAFVSGRPGLGR